MATCLVYEVDIIFDASPGVVGRSAASWHPTFEQWIRCYSSQKVYHAAGSLYDGLLLVSYAHLSSSFSRLVSRYQIQPPHRCNGVEWRGEKSRYRHAST